MKSSLRFGQPSTPNAARHEPLALVRAALELLGSRLGASGTTIAVDAPEPLPGVFVDDGQVVQALVILLDNALDATQDAAVDATASHDTKVHVLATPLSNGARIDVGDTGPGVPAELAGRIFAPFFTTKPKGTGLGLSIARKLVLENRGRLTFESEPGRTIFSVELPGDGE